MILQCPRCLTKWRVDSSLLDEDGSAVRCSRCGEEFTAYPPPTAMGRASEEGSPDRERPKPSSPRQELQEFLSESGPAAEAESLSEAVAKKPRKPKPPQKKAKKRHASRAWLVIILVLLIIIGGGLGGILVMKNRGVHLDRKYLGIDLYQAVGQLKAKLGIGVRGSSRSGGAKPTMTEKPAVRISGAAEVVEAAYRRLESPAAGSLHVISGMIKNLTDGPISEIIIEGVLLSPQDETVMSQTTYAGASVPDKVLAGASRKALKAVLEAWGKSGGPGVTVKPGQTAPFLLVFMNVPREAKSYRVEVGSVYPGVNQRKPVGMEELFKAAEGDGGQISEKLKFMLGGG